MRQTVITLMGFSLTFRYTVYEGGYIEWHLHQETPFTEVLLRIHYNSYIEAELRKCWFEESYAEDQINAAQMSLGLPDINF